MFTLTQSQSFVFFHHLIIKKTHTSSIYSYYFPVAFRESQFFISVCKKKNLRLHYPSHPFQPFAMVCSLISSSENSNSYVALTLTVPHGWARASNLRHFVTNNTIFFIFVIKIISFPIEETTCTQIWWILITYQWFTQDLPKILLQNRNFSPNKKKTRVFRNFLVSQMSYRNFGS